MAAEGLVLAREVGAEVGAAALAARQRALGEQPGQERGRGAQALEPLGAADHAGVGPERHAPAAAPAGASGRTGGAGPAGGGPAAPAAAPRGAAAEDEALEQRVRGEPVRAVDAGRGALAGGVEAGQARAPVEVGDDAADRVVRGRRDRDRLARGVVAGARERRHQTGEAVALDRAQVETGLAAFGDGARDDVAGRELVGEPPAAAVEQERALAAQRLREQEAVVEERGRVELDELEVGERRPGPVGVHESLAV